MIQPNELRIGNIVNPISRNSEIHLPIKSVFWKIQSVSESSVGVYSLDLPRYKQIPLVESVRNISPVELTPDILESAGFGVNKDNSFGYINENEGILIELGDFYEDDGRAVFYYNLPDTDNSTCIAYCKYLHQLQNLYWCLCGEELQIDITKLNKEK